MLDASNCDPGCPLTGDPNMNRPTDDSYPSPDDSEAETGAQTGTQEGEEQEDSDPIDSSNVCCSCGVSVTRVNDYCENGNLQQDDAQANNTNDTNDDDSVGNPPEFESVSNGFDSGQLTNGNDPSENDDYEVGSDEMGPQLRCANCEANAREHRSCVIDHLKSVGKSFR